MKIFFSKKNLFRIPECMRGKGEAWRHSSTSAGPASRVSNLGKKPQRPGLTKNVTSTQEESKSSQNS
jgi:hypothetical protein